MTKRIFKGMGIFAAALAMLMFMAFVPVSAIAAGQKLPAESCGYKVPNAESTDFSFIDVLITTGSTATITLKLHGNYYVGPEKISVNGTESNPYTLTITAYQGEAYALNSSGGQIAHADRLELTRVYLNHEAGYAKLYDCASSSTEGKLYLGNFIFSSYSNGNLRMVNRVPLAHYAFGIISWEMNYAFEPDALRAQAVAAKCYGASYISDSNVYYDTQDGFGSATSCQGYRGYSTNANRLTTMQYCIDVVGTALAYDGRVIPTFYGATNGGETALPSHIFGGSNYDAAYGVRIDDIEFEYVVDRRQELNIMFGETPSDSKFRDFILGKVRDNTGYAPAAVVSVDEMYAYDPVEGTERNMQRVYVKATVRYWDDTVAQHEIDFEATDLNTYDLTDWDYSGDSYTSSNNNVFTRNYEMYWGRETMTEVQTDDGVEMREGYDLFFARHGHGIGLSQMGANVYADPSICGWDYRSILEFYYANFDLITIEEANPELPLTASDEIVAYGECTSNGTNFRVGPSTSYNSLGTLSAGEHIDIIGTSGTWYQAIWDGHFGYIHRDYVDITMFPAPADSVFTVYDGITNASTTLRSAPFSASPSLAILAADTELTVWATIGSWYYVQTASGACGFVSASDVDILSAYQYSGVAIINKAPRLHNSISLGGRRRL